MVNRPGVAISARAVADAPASSGPGAAPDGYGHAAALVGVALVWYASWTLLCNVAVLAGLHYAQVFPVGLAIPTIVAGVAGWLWWMPVARAYRYGGAPGVPRGVSPMLVVALAIAAATGAMLIAINHEAPGLIWPGRHLMAPRDYAGAAVVFVGAVLTAWCLARVPVAAIGAPRRDHGRDLVGGRIDWRLLAMLIVLFGLYYFGHRADEDDSNFVNLALGAQRSAGSIFQLDTMLGDGPTPLHLPTYKFHSFELLGAAVSSLTGIAPIVALHLVLPVPELLLLALVFWLVLAPVLGRHWLAAAIMVLAFLFLDTRTFGSWGLQGVVRFFQGKGFLVTALVPLIAGLTARWMIRGRWSDIVALGLAEACAVGFSANGLYDGPTCSALVAAAFVVSAIRDPQRWRRAIGLLPTLVYPAAIALVIVTQHLAFPSEVIVRDASLPQLLSVASGGIGMVLMVLILVSGAGLIHLPQRRAALVFTPLSLLLLLNPLTWPLIQSATGNLAFRIFWAVPWPLLIGAALVTLMLRVGIRRELLVLPVAAAGLLVAILVNVRAEPAYRVHWHRPTLKVNPAQEADAAFLAGVTRPGCRVLAPEIVSQWLTTMAQAPYPVFAREMYLVHYRFTMQPRERRLREELRRVVDGDGTATPPDPAALAAAGIPIGTVAAIVGTPAAASADALAHRLNLPGPGRHGDLLVWAGACRTR